MGPEETRCGKIYSLEKRDRNCKIEIKMRERAEFIQKKIATIVDVEWSRHDE